MVGTLGERSSVTRGLRREQTFSVFGCGTGVLPVLDIETTQYALLTEERVLWVPQLLDARVYIYKVHFPQQQGGTPALPVAESAT